MKDLEKYQREIERQELVRQTIVNPFATAIASSIFILSLLFM